MNITGKYVFDTSDLLTKSYELLCVFFSEKELARRTNPNDPNSAIAQLRYQLFESTVARLLIEIAASLRVMADQMKKLPAESEEKINYFERLKAIDKYDFEIFNEKLKLRDVCNKIIHADTFEILFDKGEEANEYDYAYRAGDADKTIEWKYPNGHVRLAGNYNRKDWHIRLDIEVFITAVVDLFRPNNNIENN